ncbi:unnamed protein product, partial [Laminaria digitata]
MELSPLSLVQGGYGIQERSSVDQSKSVTFGASAAAVGKAAPAVTTPQCALGSIGEATESGAGWKGDNATMEGLSNQVDNVTIEAESSQSEPPSTDKAAESCPAVVADVSGVVGATSVDAVTRSWFQ